MSILDRVLMGVVSALLLITATFIALAVWGNTILITWLAGLTTTPFDGGIVSFILALLGIYLIVMITKTDTDKRAIVHNTELGVIRISLHSIKGLIMKATHQLQGVQDVTVQLTEGEPIHVRIDLTMLPDHHIPQLTEAVQIKIRDYLQETVGITVEEIDVYVKDIASTNKSRVE